VTREKTLFDFYLPIILLNWVDPRLFPEYDSTVFILSRFVAPKPTRSSFEGQAPTEKKRSRVATKSNSRFFFPASSLLRRFEKRWDSFVC
jgi:hypothetical protein